MSVALSPDENVSSFEPSPRSDLFTFMLGGPEPELPIPGCGAETTPDGLECETFDACSE